MVHVLTIFVIASLQEVPTPKPLEKPESLHPAFKKSALSLKMAWEKGETDAPKLRDPLRQIQKFRRGIGKIRTAPLREETVSWVWYLPPENFNYFVGFESKKKYMPEEEIAPLKKLLLPDQDVYQKAVEFYGTISLYPSWAGAYGTISRHANPSDLKDVRVVLQVGTRIIQPKEQPGDLLQISGSGTSTFSIPTYDYATVTSSATASTYGSAGYAYGTATGTSSLVRRYNTYHAQGYDWYQGSFSAVFPLFDREGNPNITKDDKEMTFIVIYGTNERKAIFGLKDIEKPL